MNNRPGSSLHRFRIATGIVILLLILISIFFYVRHRHNAEIESRMDEIAQLMEEEKHWILSNQAPEGAFYLNSSNGAKDVNPYFSAIGAIGLLAGDPDGETLDAVTEYLNWYIKEYTEHGGVMENHRDYGSGLEGTGSYDSIDSYTAVMLVLLGKYCEKGGDPEDISNFEEGIALAYQVLDGLTEDGLARVSHDNGVKYLMDNVEVHAAYKMGVQFLKVVSERNLWDEAEYWAEQFTRSEKDSDDAIIDKLWDEESARFLIGLSEHGNEIQAGSDFYPDWLAQIHPIAWEFDELEAETEILYDEFCEVYEWESEDFIDEEGFWPELAYIAGRIGDIDRVASFLNSYQITIKRKRAYPYHVGSAGWNLRACGELLRLYEESKW